MKKIIAFALCLLALVLPLTGCMKAYSDEEAKEIVLPLLEKEAALNPYLYGQGFAFADPNEYEQHKGDSSFYYAPVASDSPYLTLSQLKSAMEELYSSQLMETVGVYAFGDPDKTSDTIVTARFYQKMSPEQLLGEDKNLEIAKNDAQYRLRVDAASYETYKLTARIDAASLKVTRATRSLIEMSASYYGNSGVKREMTFTVIFENGVWKLDSRTYLIGFYE